MSTESVSQFLSVVSSDSALKEKLAAITDSVNFIQIAEDSGYSFTLEDLQAYIAQHNNGELSEDELEAVAGGHNLNAVAGGHNSHIALLRDFWTSQRFGDLGSRCAPGGNSSPSGPKGPIGGPVGHEY